MAPILGPDGRPLADARLVRHRIDRRGRRHALCRHRARPPDRALRLRQGRPARARRSRSRCRRACERCRATRGSRPGRSCRKAPARSAGTLIAISERGLDNAGNHHRLPDRRADARARSRSSAATISTSATPRCCRAATCCCWSASSAGPAGSAMRIRRIALADIKPGALVDGAGPVRGRSRLPDRQHGRLERSPQRQRRDRADADLRRQFLAPAAHAAAAVHAGASRDQEA